MLVGDVIKELMKLKHDMKLDVCVFHIKDNIEEMPTLFHIGHIVNNDEDSAALMCYDISVPGTVDDLVAGKKFKTYLHLSEDNTIDVETTVPKAELISIKGKKE